MGLTDKMSALSSNVQNTTIRAGYGLSHILLRIVSGFFIGAVLALIFQELFSLGTFILIFLTVLFLAMIFKILSQRTVFQIIIFDFICVLIGSLLRMYILVAPN
jgi:hypothetical protein